MDALHHEGDDAGLVLGRAQDAQARNGGEPIGGVGQQLVLVGRDAVESESVEVVDGRAQADGGGDGGRARLELTGGRHVGGLLPGDGADHVAAPMPGRHGLQVGQLAVEDADARGARELVAAEGVEIRIQVHHVHLQVRHGLGAIHQHGHTLGMGPGDDLLHGVHGAEDVADVHHADDLRAFGDEFVKAVEDQLAGIGHGDDLDRGALLLGQHLPGHDVGVVLHGGEQDLVALLDVDPAVGLGHEVDGLGGAAGPDDLLDGAGADEPSHLLPGGLVEIGGLLAEGAHAAVDIGVLLPLVLGHALDDCQRHLAAHGAVEVDHGLAVQHPGQQGEIPADRGEVEGVEDRAHAKSPSEAAWVRAMTSWRRDRRRLATGMCVSTSAAKP